MLAMSDIDLKDHEGHLIDKHTGICSCGVVLDPPLSFSEMDRKFYEMADAIVCIAESLKTIADCLEDRRN